MAEDAFYDNPFMNEGLWFLSQKSTGEDDAAYPDLSMPSVKVKIWFSILECGKQPMNYG